MLALTGCGRAESGRAPAPAGSFGDGSSSSEDPSVDGEEQDTPSGIAAIVLEHLGSDALVEFVTNEQEPGSLSVRIRLRDASPHNFGVQVHSSGAG